MAAGNENDLHAQFLRNFGIMQGVANHESILGFESKWLIDLSLARCTFE
jgi:hypothetical protein